MSQTMVDGGALLVRTLRSTGVDVAFVLHGGHLYPIFPACMDQGIRLVDTRHEAAAGHAADAYARQTGRVVSLLRKPLVSRYSLTAKPTVCFRTTINSLVGV